MRLPINRHFDCMSKCQGYTNDFCCGEFCERLAAIAVSEKAPSVDYVAISSPGRLNGYVAPSTAAPIIRLKGDALDEVCAPGFHLEQMSATHWWMEIESGGEAWHVNFHSKATIAAQAFLDRKTHPNPTAAPAGETPRYVGGFCQDREKCVSRNAELAALKSAADKVCWFDWSDNDSDAVAAIEILRAARSSKTDSKEAT